MSLNADRALQAWTSGAVYLNSIRYRFSALKNRPQKGQKIRLLLTGYNGTRNTGADVRVHEIVRQVHSVLGKDHVDVSVLTFDPKLTEGYFEGVRQVSLPQIFPPFLFRECPKYHGIISVEGSMFKSKFADALTTMMAGSLGMANSENKLSVGYGAEAGSMTPSLTKFVQKHASESLVICRNKASEDILDGLHIRTQGGTDTAWTFEPSPDERGQAILRSKGWDGTKPILLVAPIHPFWWPVKPNLAKYVGWKFLGKEEKSHYKSIYFHDLDEEKDRKFHTYLQQIVRAVETFNADKRYFVSLVAMERLDDMACREMAGMFGHVPPTLSSRDLNMFDMVSCLRQANILISSRFHAMVCSMPAGVASIGITMDERITNLMKARGHEDLLCQVDDANLEEKLETMLTKAEKNKDALAEDIYKTVGDELKKMAEMGKALYSEVSRVFPDVNLGAKPRSTKGFLPPISPNLKRMLDAKKA